MASHATHQAEDEETFHVLEAGFSPHAHALADARRKLQEADASRARACCTSGSIGSLSFPNSSHSNDSTLLLAMDFPTKGRQQKQRWHDLAHTTASYMDGVIGRAFVPLQLSKST